MDKTFTKERIAYLDIAKGLGIIFVILAHIGISEMFDTWMYSFHLPLFYLVSGMCFNCRDSIKDFFVRRIKRCIIPYFCLGMVVVAVEAYTGYLYEKGWKANFIRLLVQKRYSTLWFLATLFFASLLFWIIIKICKKRPLLVLVISIACSVGAYYYAITIWEPLFWNMDVAAFVVAFMGVGYFLSHGIRGLEFSELKSWQKAVLGAVFLTINIVLCYMNYKASGWRMDMYWNQYGVYLYTLIAALSGSMFVLMISSILSGSKSDSKNCAAGFIANGLRYLGKNSLLYFAWHQSVVMAPVMGVLKKQHINESYTKMITFIVIIIVCTLADILIRNTRLRFVIGE